MQKVECLRYNVFERALKKGIRMQEIQGVAEIFPRAIFLCLRESRAVQPQANGGMGYLSYKDNILKREKALLSVYKYRASQKLTLFFEMPLFLSFFRF